MNTQIQFAQIEPTTRCNYTCGFCAGRSMRQGDLEWNVFERFLDANPGLRHVELQGEGEPLMHPRFFDMVAACKARSIAVSLISNGSMLGATAVERLIEHGVDSVHVSLESADPTEFQAIRGGKLHKVVEGLRTLMRRRRELGKVRPTVGFSVTVLRQTIPAIPGIVDLYRELELDGGISVQLLQDMACYTEHYSEEMLRQLVPAELWRSCDWLVNAAVASAPVQSGAVSYYGMLFREFHPGAGKCPWLERGAYLNIDGNVTGCCFIKNPLHAFGNVLSDSPETIEDRRRAAADLLKNGVVPPPCRGCGVAEAVTRAGQRQTPPFPILNTDNTYRSLGGKQC